MNGKCPSEESTPVCGPASARPEGLKYRPDWPRVRDRLTALWAGCNIDRPCIDIRTPKQSGFPWPARPADLEDLYFDPGYTEQYWTALFEHTHFLGEAVPTGPFFMGGYALGCGEAVTFAPDTVWHGRLMDSIDGPIRWRPGPDDPWRVKLDRLIRHLTAAAPGKFLVGGAGQVPVNDLLPLIGGVGEFLADMGRDVELCRRRLEELWPAWHENMRHYLDMMLAAGQGCVLGWPGIWHPDVLLSTQSDMSCMISAHMFDRYVMRELDLLGERYGYVWYHLDGSGAVRHLPALLSRPYIKAIQYVPSCDDPPNGPGLMHIYRQVQAAGRCLDIQAPWENVEYLIRRLRPEGLLLRTCAPSLEAADALLENAAKWSGSDLTR